MNMTKKVSLDHLDKKASDCVLIFEGVMGKSLQLVELMCPLTQELLIFAAFSLLHLEEGESDIERERETD